MSVFYRLPDLARDIKPTYTMKDKYGTDVTLWHHYKKELTEIRDWLDEHEIHPMPKIEFDTHMDVIKFVTKVGVKLTFLNPHDETMFRMSFM